MKNNLIKGVIKIPKVICKGCGKVWYGWALIYKFCICDCGYMLNQIRNEE